MVNAYEAGMVLFAGKTVRSMPERLRGFTTRRYVNPRYLSACYKTSWAVTENPCIWMPIKTSSPMIPFNRWYTTTVQTNTKTHRAHAGYLLAGNIMSNDFHTNPQTVPGMKFQSTKFKFSLSQFFYVSPTVIYATFSTNDTHIQFSESYACILMYSI